MKINLISTNGNIDLNSSEFNALGEVQRIQKIVHKLFVFCGKMGGECYSTESLDKIMKEDEATTIKRATFCLNKMHHSLFEHAKLTLELVDIPKFILMMLNNQYVYTTSERSARYTDFYNLIETDLERNLYTKWGGIISSAIETIYPQKFSEKERIKLAQENARYMISVFVPSSMVYTISLRDLNYLIFEIRQFLNTGFVTKTKINHDFMQQLKPRLEEFLRLLEPYEIKGLVPKSPRMIEIFNNALSDESSFEENYKFHYKLSFAAFAQEHRHRSIRHSIELTDSYYVPPIIYEIKAEDDWLLDLKKNPSMFAQGRMVLVTEQGNIKDFIGKCYERICGRAQLEIERATRRNLARLKTNSSNHVKDYIFEVTGNESARCAFPEFHCSEPCKFGKKQSERLI